MENDEKTLKINDDEPSAEISTTMEKDETTTEKDETTTEETSALSTAGLSSRRSGELTSNVEAMVQKMTDGFLSEVQPQLMELREKTKEIAKNQGILMETIQQENSKYSENKEIEEFTKMISVVQSYYVKLKKIKSEMNQLDERLVKLKKRSLKLKEKRQKKDQDEAERRERELAIEQELTAKHAT